MVRYQLLASFLAGIGPNCFISVATKELKVAPEPFIIMDVVVRFRSRLISPNPGKKVRNRDLPDNPEKAKNETVKVAQKNKFRIKEERQK